VPDGDVGDDPEVLGNGDRRTFGRRARVDADAPITLGARLPVSPWGGPVSPGAASGGPVPLHDGGIVAGPVGISQDALVQFPRL
jgi:hypothetical protein